MTFVAVNSQAELDSALAANVDSIVVVGTWKRLDVYGTASGGIYVYDTASVGSIYVYGTASVGGIYVAGTVRGGIYVSGTVTGNINVSDTASVGSIYVYGTVTGSIYVAGTVRGSIYVAGTVKGIIDVYGTASVGGIYVHDTASVGSWRLDAGAVIGELNVHCPLSRESAKVLAKYELGRKVSGLQMQR